MKIRVCAFLVVFLAFGCFQSHLQAQITVTLNPSADNSLYQNSSGSLSNGIGQGLFCGRTLQGSDFLRRALLKFNVAGNIPANATITAVSLEMTVTISKPIQSTINLHLVNQNWGEGNSIAGGQGGTGGASQANDATWLHTFYSGSFWSAVGGDFNPGIQATQSVIGNGTYTWSSPNLVTTVQNWLNNPATNYGWMMRGTENVGGTAKRFASREYSIPSARPKLIVTYTVPCIPPAVPTLGLSQNTICSGTATNLTISGNLNSATNWEIYTGSCGGVLVASTVGNSVPVAPLTTTTYFVRGAGGCVVGGSCASITVTVLPSPNVVAQASSPSVCQGGSLTLQGTGAVSYTWTNGVTNGVPFIPTNTASYIVTGLASNGCTGMDTILIPVFPLPNPPVIGGLAGSYCANAPVVTLTKSPVTSVFSGPGMNGNNFNPAAAGPGVHTISLLFTDGNGCQRTTTQQVTVHPAPVASFTGLATTYCRNNASVPLTGSPGGGSFSGPGMLGNVFNPFAAGTGTHGITYLFTDGNGCSDTEVKLVTVNDTPTVSIGGLNLSYCLNSAPVSLTGNPAGGVFSGPGIAGNVFNPLNAGLGVHTVVYTQTNGSGCTGTIRQNVVVNQPPVAGFSGLQSTFCTNNTPVSLIGNPAGGVFSGPGLTGNIFNPLVAGAGVHTIVYTVTDGNGCSDSEQQMVTVHDTPTVSMSGLIPVYCENDAPVTLTGNPAGGVFSGPGITGNVFSPANAGVGNIQLTYSLTDGNGCSGTIQQAVSIQPFPVVSFSGLNATYCRNSSAVTLTGNPAGGTFSGPGINGNTFSPFLAGPGTHLVEYMYSLGNGCSDVIQQSVTVFDTTAITFTGLSASYCENAAVVTLTGNPAGGTFFGPGVAGNLFSPLNAGAGNHVVAYSLINLDGCVSVSQQPVQVFAVPVLSISGLSGSYCLNQQAVQLTGNPAGGVFSGPGINGNIFSPAISGVGTHNIAYSFTDGNGCSEQIIQNVIVFDTTMISFAVLPPSFCENDSPVLLSGNPAGGTFSGSGVTGNTFVPAQAVIGMNTISYTYVNPDGCLSTLTQQTTVNSQPVVSVSGANASYCLLDSSAALTGNPLGGVFSGPGMTGNIFDPQSAGIGTHIITYSFIDGNGCGNMTSASIAVLSNPVVSASFSSDTLCEGISLTLSGNGASIYVWDQGVVDNIPFFPSSGTYVYHLTGTDVNGCSANDSVAILVNPVPQISVSGILPSYCESDGSVIPVFSPSGGIFTGTGVSNGEFNPANAGSGNHVLLYEVSNVQGCMNDTLIPVTVLPLPAAAFSFVVSDPVVSLTDASQHADSLLWDFGDGNSSTQVNPVYTYAQNGSYNVCLIAYNSCGTDTFCNSVNIVTLDVESAGEEAIHIFPNPATDKLVLQTNLENYTWQILDARGRIILQAPGEVSGQTVLDISTLSGAVYLLRFIHPEKSAVLHLIKQ